MSHRSFRVKSLLLGDEVRVLDRVQLRTTTTGWTVTLGSAIDDPTGGTMTSTGTRSHHPLSEANESFSVKCNVTVHRGPTYDRHATFQHNANIGILCFHLANRESFVSLQWWYEHFFSFLWGSTSKSAPDVGDAENFNGFVLVGFVDEETSTPTPTRAREVSATEIQNASDKLQAPYVELSSKESIENIVKAVSHAVARRAIFPTKAEEEFSFSGVTDCFRSSLCCGAVRLPSQLPTSLRTALVAPSPPRVAAQWSGMLRQLRALDVWGDADKKKQKLDVGSAYGPPPAQCLLHSGPLLLQQDTQRENDRILDELMKDVQKLKEMSMATH